MSEPKSQVIYVDALGKIQFNSNNFKLTFVETEDMGDNKLKNTEVVKLVLSLESTIKMTNAIADFLKKLTDAKTERKDN